MARKAKKTQWPAEKPENEGQLQRQAAGYVKRADPIGTRYSVMLPDGTPIIDQPQNMLERITEHIRRACNMPDPHRPGGQVFAH